MSKVPIVEIDAAPPLSDRELETVRVALARLGVDLSPSPRAGASAWQVASAREAVESELPRFVLRSLAAQDSRRDAGVV